MKTDRSAPKTRETRSGARARLLSPSRALCAFLEAQGYAGVPLERNAVGHFQARGSLAGRPALFILDTGASHTVLDRGRLAAFGLRERVTRQKAGGLGTTIHAVSRTRAGSLALGGVETGPRALNAIDLAHVNAALTQHRAQAVDGVIGGDLLAELAAVIDYAGRVLYVRSRR
ncbi:MAG: retroviral-like aspartic protease family protein [Planctomycetes bacterium]|jgi:predicted aspartyl protease|nr:retroviral-like aspartic protease family protein [Planctomycetota bacterium]